MSIYTKQGDNGRTSLMNGVRVSKTDDRIELLGAVDELSSAIGLAKVTGNSLLKGTLTQIQTDLMRLMSGIADPGNPDYRFGKEDTLILEEWIDYLEASFPRARELVLYGGCELSARLDMARALARRAERRFRKVSQNYEADPKAMQYLNRLSDYLYVAARFSDYQASQQAQNSGETMT